MHYNTMYIMFSPHREEYILVYLALLLVVHWFIVIIPTKEIRTHYHLDYTV